MGGGDDWQGGLGVASSDPRMEGGMMDEGQSEDPTIKIGLCSSGWLSPWLVTVSDGGFSGTIAGMTMMDGGGPE